MFELADALLDSDHTCILSEIECSANISAFSSRTMDVSGVHWEWDEASTFTFFLLHSTQPSRLLWVDALLLTRSIGIDSYAR
jgi:hypothetical protein